MECTIGPGRAAHSAKGHAVAVAQVTFGAGTLCGGLPPSGRGWGVRLAAQSEICFFVRQKWFQRPSTKRQQL